MQVNYVLHLWLKKNCISQKNCRDSYRWKLNLRPFELLNCQTFNETLPDISIYHNISIRILIFRTKIICRKIYSEFINRNYIIGYHYFRGGNFYLFQIFTLSLFPLSFAGRPSHILSFFPYLFKIIKYGHSLHNYLARKSQ